jgi:hypothetical protein
MWPAFPTSDYYEDSVPRCRHPSTMDEPCTLRCEGGDARVPTFTDFRLTGLVPSYTPATSPRAKRSHARGLDDTIGLRRRRAVSAISCRATSIAPAHIHQIGAGRRLEGPQTLIHFRCTFPSRLRGHGVWQCRRSATLSGLLSGLTRISRAQPALSFSRPLRRSRGDLGGPRGNTAPRGAQPTSSTQRRCGTV